ncbi:T9SS type A sorting domain-containing protein [Aegicerativicinus sediminis]|uniref:T9SS type A sorting domain-containing protein n=1 Tax=Aegicerativicinus sediminis TaxID=2893202 RepID=UPI001E5A0FD3|nr:T9SS type A sorting domain-containing protein [Aegicerativicinus sediminis]
MYAQYVINVDPAPAAEIVDPGFPASVDCTTADGWEAPSVSYTNGIDGACSNMGELEPDVDFAFDQCGGTITVTYSGVDQCENALYAQYVINVDPAPAAEIVDPGFPASVDCTTADGWEAPSVSYTNGIDGACSNMGELEPDVDFAFDQCGGTITVTYSGVDQCENALYAQYVINVDPAPEAEVDVPSLPTELTCLQADAFMAPSATFSNGSDGQCVIEGVLEASVTENWTSCGGTITVEYIGQDNCERPLYAGPYEITVLPMPQARFAPLEDIEISCEELDSFEPGYSNQTGGGSLGLTCAIRGRTTGVADPFDASCGQFNVTYTFTDTCGRTITHVQVVTVVDEVPPMLIDSEIGCSSLDMTGLEWCYDDAQAFDGETLIADVKALYMDNCDTDLDVTLTDTELTGTNCGWEKTFTYEIEDNCENVVMCSVTYSGGDTTAPTLEGELPTGETGISDCQPEMIDDAPTAEDIAALFDDNCGNVVVERSGPSVEGDDCSWTLTYTYTVKDECGNAFVDFPVTVSYSGGDDQDPEITVRPYDDLICEVEAPEYLYADWTDNCATGDELMSSAKTMIESGWNYEVYEYTFYVEDNCENDASITVQVRREFNVLGEGETVFGYRDNSDCFLDYDFSRWGWTTKIIEPGIYNFDLYAGNGNDCDPTDGPGVFAGVATLNYDGSEATVSYDMNDGFILSEAHVYIGCTMFPQQERGKGDYVDTVAPGQYNLNPSLGGSVDQYTVGPVDVSGDFYIIIHGVSQEILYQCSEEYPYSGDNMGSDSFDGAAPVSCEDNEGGDGGNNPSRVAKTSDVQVSPNPFVDLLNVNFEYNFNTKVKIEVLNVNGAILRTYDNIQYKANAKGKKTLDLSTVYGNMLFVRVTSDEGSIVKKVISADNK